MILYMYMQPITVVHNSICISLKHHRKCNMEKIAQGCGQETNAARGKAKGCIGSRVLFFSYSGALIIDIV